MLTSLPVEVALVTSPEGFVQCAPCRTRTDDPLIKCRSTELSGKASNLLIGKTLPVRLSVNVGTALPLNEAFTLSRAGCGVQCPPLWVDMFDDAYSPTCRRKAVGMAPDIDP